MPAAKRACNTICHIHCKACSAPRDYQRLFAQAGAAPTTPVPSAAGKKRARAPRAKKAPAAAAALEAEEDAIEQDVIVLGDDDDSIPPVRICI